MESASSFFSWGKQEDIKLCDGISTLTSLQEALSAQSPWRKTGLFPQKGKDGSWTLQPLPKWVREDTGLIKLLITPPILEPQLANFYVTLCRKIQSDVVVAVHEGVAVQSHRERADKLGQVAALLLKIKGGAKSQLAISEASLLKGNSELQSEVEHTLAQCEKMWAIAYRISGICNIASYTGDQSANQQALTQMFQTYVDLQQAKDPKALAALETFKQKCKDFKSAIRIIDFNNSAQRRMMYGIIENIENLAGPILTADMRDFFEAARNLATLIDLEEQDNTNYNPPDQQVFPILDRLQLDRNMDVALRLSKIGLKGLGGTFRRYCQRHFPGES